MSNGLVKHWNDFEDLSSVYKLKVMIQVMKIRRNETALVRWDQTALGKLEHELHMIMTFYRGVLISSKSIPIIVKCILRK